jgi:transcriptional regulator with XRE-family HTH domain
MYIGEKMPKTLSGKREETGKAMTEFAEDHLGISCTQAKIYHKGKGNPRIDTIVLMAIGTGEYPAKLMADFSIDPRIQILELLLRSYGNKKLFDKDCWNLAEKFLAKLEAIAPSKTFKKPEEWDKDELVLAIRNFISDILKYAKKYQSKSLKKFSKKLGISESHLQDILKAKRNVTWKTLTRIGISLGVEPAALISIAFSRKQLQKINLLLHQTKIQ